MRDLAVLVLHLLTTFARLAEGLGVKFPGLLGRGECPCRQLVCEQTLRKELADLGQDNEELFWAERADFLENQRCVDREQFRRLHDRFLWKYSIDAIALVDCERTVLCAL